MQKNLTDKMRSMRLQRRGAILEKHLGSDQLTDQQIELLLKTLFRRPDVHELIQQLKQEAYRHPHASTITILQKIKKP